MNFWRCAPRSSAGSSCSTSLVWNTEWKKKKPPSSPSLWKSLRRTCSSRSMFCQKAFSAARTLSRSLRPNASSVASHTGARPLLSLALTGRLPWLAPP